MNHLKKPQREINPEEAASILSKSCFFYILRLFKKGSRKRLEEKDIYEVLPNYKSKKLGVQFGKAWEKQKKDRRNPSIFRLLGSCYGPNFFLLGLIQILVNAIMLVIQPHAIGKLVSYFARGQTKISKKDAYCYGILLIGLDVLNCFYQHNTYLVLAGLGIKMRAACCSFIYRKALRLNAIHFGDVAIEKFMTLITEDVHTFETFVNYGNDVWIGIVTLIVVCCILYIKVGLASLTGITFLILLIPIQIYGGRKIAHLKTKTCEWTDKRFQLTQATLSAIRIIKMYTWEKIFEAKVACARNKEVYAKNHMFFMRIIFMGISGLTLNVAFYVILMTYIKLGNKITAEMVFFIIACFRTMTEIFRMRFPLGSLQMAELVASVKRIETAIKTIETDAIEPRNTDTSSPRIYLNNVTLAIKHKQILRKINLNIEKGLTVLSGPVSGGKSSLLKLILREYRLYNGNLMVQGTTSYASQEPWLFSSSIRQNILFGAEYDRTRYQEVLKACALLYDLQLLEHGDLAIVEDCGVNLSDGQKIRINLARAVYRKSEIYLLDDCLGALNFQISAFIFNHCITKFLKGKLVILVTQNINHFQNADNIMILHNGTIQMVEKTTELPQAEILGDCIDSNCTGEKLNCDNLENLDIRESLAGKNIYQEKKEYGKVNLEIYKKCIRSGGGLTVFAIVVGTFALAQFVASYTDILVGAWVNLEQKISNFTETNSTNVSNFKELTEQRNNLYYLYGFMIIATALTDLVRGSALFLFFRKVSIELHKKMLATIFTASMQTYDTHFIGNILSRCSEDFTRVDEMVPLSFHHFIKILLKILGTITLIIQVNIIFLIPTLMLLLLLIILTKYYLQTARALWRLDAVAKDRLVGYINSTLKGLTTVRAHRVENILIDEFDAYQDIYTSVSYTIQCSITAFNFVLDMLCTSFISVIVIKLIIEDDSNLAGYVGLAISQAFLMTGALKWGVRHWTEIENEMTSVERILQYTEIKPEDSVGCTPEEWPKRGTVKYKNVRLPYTNSNQSILKQSNFTVKSKERTGIVARTGVFNTFYSL